MWTTPAPIKGMTIYFSDWLCSDNDCAELFIDDIGKTLELRCFSGIPASSILIDSIDFGHLKRTEINDKIDFNAPFEEQCFIIADYLCGLFCEKLK